KSTTLTICAAPRPCSVNAPSPERAYVVDARSAAGPVTPWTPVAGVPLACRHVRQAARAGRAGVTIVVADAAARGAALAALAFRPAPGVRVTVEVGAPPPGAQVVPALSVFASGELVREIRGADDLEFAEKQLAAAVRKSLEHDGFVAYYLM